MELIARTLRQGVRKLYDFEKQEVENNMPFTLILCIVAFLLWGTTSI